MFLRARIDSSKFLSRATSFCWLAVLNPMALFELVNSLFFFEETPKQYMQYKIFHIYVETKPISNYENLKTNIHTSPYIIKSIHLLIFLTQQTIWIIVGFALEKNYYFSKNKLRLFKCKLRFLFFSFFLPRFYLE